MTHFSVTVQPDNQRGHEDQFMVVIEQLIEYGFDIKREIVGIPLRGVSRDTAETYLNPLRFAFEYGAGVAVELVQQKLAAMSSTLRCSHDIYRSQNP